MINLEALRVNKQLGLGCSTFGGSVSKKKAIFSLEQAYDKGITYFDVARSYGFGQAESIVGQFAQGKRDNIVITSKFGILPPEIPFKQLLIWGLRNIKTKIPLTEKSIRNKSIKLKNKSNFTPSLAEKSLNKSLKELKTDYIDLYLFHEATYDDYKRDDMYYFLEKVKKEGKIRAWGATLSDRTCLKKELRESNHLDILQFPFGLDTIYDQVVNSTTSIQVVYSVINYLNSSIPLIKPTYLANLKIEIPELNFLESTHDLLIYLIFRELMTGVILLSMTSTKHINKNILIWENANQSKVSKLPSLKNLLKENE